MTEGITQLDLANTKSCLDAIKNQLGEEGKQLAEKVELLETIQQNKMTPENWQKAIQLLDQDVATYLKTHQNNIYPERAELSQIGLLTQLVSTGTLQKLNLQEEVYSELLQSAKPEELYNFFQAILSAQNLDVTPSPGELVVSYLEQLGFNNFCQLVENSPDHFTKLPQNEQSLFLEQLKQHSRLSFKKQHIDAMQKVVSPELRQQFYLGNITGVVEDNQYLYPMFLIALTDPNIKLSPEEQQQLIQDMKNRQITPDEAILEELINQAKLNIEMENLQQIFKNEVIEPAIKQYTLGRLKNAEQMKQSVNNYLIAQFFTPEERQEIYKKIIRDKFQTIKKEIQANSIEDVESLKVSVMELQLLCNFAQDIEVDAIDGLSILQYMLQGLSDKDIAINIVDAILPRSEEEQRTMLQNLPQEMKNQLLEQACRQYCRENLAAADKERTEKIGMALSNDNFLGYMLEHLQGEEMARGVRTILIGKSVEGQSVMLQKLSPELQGKLLQSLEGENRIKATKAILHGKAEEEQRTILQSLSQELQDALLTQVCESYCREQNPTDARKEELERIHKALTSTGHGHSFLLNEKSELGKFVSNIEEDAQPLNKFLAQVQNIQGSKLQDKINIDWMMKNTELPTLRKLYQVTEKLSFEKEAEKKKLHLLKRLG